MSNLTSDAVMAALAEFIQRRREGLSREQAWTGTLEAATLSEAEQETLLNLAKKWEQREGNKHLTSDTRATTVMEIPPLGGIRAVNSVLNPSPTTADPDPPIRSGDTAPFQPPRPESAPLKSKMMQVLIYFKDFPKPIQLSLEEGKEIIIGRATPESPMSPDIDLTPLRGAEYGISRLHASLQRRGEKLFLSDLGSRNYTFLNTEQLVPHEVRAVNDGDRIWFARLLAQINYRLL